MQKTATAKLSYLRISARKVKIVIDMIRNKPVGEALAILRLTPKAASQPVEKLLLSAIANAEANHNMDVEALYIAEIYANQGPTLKRIQPRAQGRAFRILKRTSHVTIVLKENEEVLKIKEEAAKKATKKSTKKAATTEEAAEKKTTAKKSTAKKTTKKAEATEEKAAEVSAE